jgi:hypothetical protein
MTQPAPTTKISCRPIRGEDLPVVADLLHAGFPSRTREYWGEALRRLAARTPPEDCVQFGHLLEVGGRPAGVLLMIFSASPDGSGPSIRGNVSSWYVMPEARTYAGLLVLRALRPRAASFINVSPAPWTPPIITAQGFKKFSAGIFAALPAFARRGSANTRLNARPEEWSTMRGIGEADLRLLRDHDAFGCLGLWCETRDGGQPFVFRRRRIKPGGIPCAQLIYCRSLEDLEHHAGALGRFLTLRGMPLLLVPSDRALRGVPGRLFPQRLPIYFRGATAPRIGDLSYTEAALFGF